MDKNVLMILVWGSGGLVSLILLIVAAVEFTVYLSPSSYLIYEDTGYPLNYYSPELLQIPGTFKREVTKAHYFYNISKNVASVSISNPFQLHKCIFFRLVKTDMIILKVYNSLILCYIRVQNGSQKI